MRNRLIAALLAVMCGANAHAQLITGTISGTIADQSGGGIPSAKVTLVNDATAEARFESTEQGGFFNFSAVNPGTYTVRVEAPGFRSFERTRQVVQAGDHVSLGTVALELGQVSDRISVTAQGAQVQTSSSEQAASLDSTQISLIQSKARDPISLLRLLPGAAITGAVNTDTLGGNFGSATPAFNGMRAAWNNTSIDGQTESNTFDQSVFNGMSSLDSIAEAKVTISNYQAEYGRNSGVFVDFISKSGTRDFHGNAYWFDRNEAFNANDFYNNRSNVARPVYRYSNFGGTLGGPIFIPGRFNANRDKLFFFFSGELWKIKYPGAQTTLTMPTDLERKGDFSQTLDVGGKLVPIIDPVTHQQFPGNVIPASRINPDGQHLFTIFPEPNFVNRAVTGGSYNYVYQRILTQPKNTELLKVDYNVSAKDRLKVRGRDYYSDQQGYGINIGPPWPLVKHHYAFPSHSVDVNYIRTFSATLLNEASFGRRWGGESSALTSPHEVDFLSRKALGVNIGQFHPENNPLNVIPQITFGGVPNAPSFTLDDRFPLFQVDHQYEGRDTLTYKKGRHIMKFGILIEQNYTDKGIKGNSFGTFSFAKDTQNPLDANYAFANALLGNFQSYTEASQRVSAPVTHLLYEWFAQDTWTVSRRLTLDYGMRFSWGTPYTEVNGNAGAFTLDRYNLANVPALIRPGLDPVSKTRVGINPATGQSVPAIFIDTFAPGTGDVANGLINSADPNYPRGFRYAAPVQYAPRFGFAYDVFGNGKWAVRGGFGITKQETLSADPMVYTLLTSAPVVYYPVIYYSNLNTFLSASGALGPQSVKELEKNPITPSLYSYDLTIEHEIGFGTVVRAAYVGNVGRHLEQDRNINLPAPNSGFLPQNLDNTIAVNTATGQASALNPDFYRPYPGIGDIVYVENSGTSNYNALQISANRRYAKGVQFGLAYTWSKTMDLVDSDGGLITTYFNARSRLYGKAGFDQTHVFTLNYVWDLPKASKLANNVVVRQVLDNWQLSGVTTFASGFPTGIGYSTVNGLNITRGGDPARVNLTGVAEKPRGDRTFQQFFNTSVIAEPTVGDYGNAPKDVFRGPGFTNFDISAFKNIPLHGDTRVLQLRGEAYNAFNHTQYAGVNTNAQFDATGKQVNALFGTVNSTRTPRILQVSLNFKF